jgi:hypothetical protein
LRLKNQTPLMIQVVDSKGYDKDFAEYLRKRKKKKKKKVA